MREQRRQDGACQAPWAAIRWTLGDERVSTLNIGVSLPTDVDKNIAMLKGDLKLTNDDRLLLAEFSGRAYENDKIKNMKTVKQEDQKDCHRDRRAGCPRQGDRRAGPSIGGKNAPPDPLPMSAALLEDAIKRARTGQEKNPIPDSRLDFAGKSTSKPSRWSPSTGHSITSTVLALALCCSSWLKKKS